MKKDKEKKASEEIKKAQEALKEITKGFNYFQYVAENIPQSLMLSNDEMSHVAHGLESMVNDLVGNCSAGSFIKAVINNDLIEACRKADDINKVSLWVYAIFMRDIVPISLRHKNKKKEAEEIWI